MKDERGNEIVLGSLADETSKQTSPSQSVEAPKISFKSRLSAGWHIFWVRKKLSIPITILLIGLILAVMPFTRYPIFGLFLSQDYSIKVIDSDNGQPVSNAKVSLGSSDGATDANGEAKLKSKVGSRLLKIEKKHYESTEQKVTVPLTRSEGVYRFVKIKATGRQVPVAVKNKLTGQAVAGAVIKVADSESTTGEDGQAVVVVPAGIDKLEATLSSPGHNQVTATVKVSEAVLPENEFKLTPSGKVYFLSKLSGKIDVVKTDLDGSNRQTVLAGTGKEEEAGTVLLASRDWKYLALLSRRDGGENSKLFLIDTQAGDQVTTMDEGDASFDLTGWADHYFAYKVTRKKVDNWQGKKYALKTYNADTKKIVLLDETQGSGDASNNIYEEINWVYNIGSELIYFKSWSAYKQSGSYTFPELGVKQTKVVSIQTDGSNRKDLKSFDLSVDVPYYTYTSTPYSSYSHVLYEPKEVFFGLYAYGGSATFYKLEGTQVKEDSEAKEFFDGGKAYPTYLISPDGTKSFWAESRDGKNTLFIGDSSGASGQEVAKLSEFSHYGWYTQDYLLVTKNGSELFIMSAAGGEPFKISDYHRPAINYYGYGGGYGGL
jgi:hypothetical protein